MVNTVSNIWPIYGDNFANNENKENYTQYGAMLSYFTDQRTE